MCRITCRTVIRKQLKFINRRQFTQDFIENELALHFSPLNVKKVLKAKNIAFEDGFTNFAINCPICEKNKEFHETSKVYVNKITGILFKVSCMHTQTRIISLLLAN